jgi:hypothetical protein
MYQVAIIKADYEGWWLFDDWQNDIDTSYEFQDKDHMITFYHELLEDMKIKFHSYTEGKYGMHAFFNACELEYCEECEDSLQIFHTPVMMIDGEVVKL